MRSFRSVKSVALILAASLAAPALVPAQDVVAPTYVEVAPATASGPAAGLDIPQPPGSTQAQPVPPLRRLPPVPEGPDNGLPQPISPPISGIAGPGAPCDLRYFVNRYVDLSGTVPTVGDPSAACDRGTCFYTWNRGAALSLNSGITWSFVDPYTKFPAIDGGFCCNQRTLRVDLPDMTIWVLQYAKSATTQLGHVRIAIASGRDDLAANVWHSYVFAPSTFGFGLGEYLDFPDVAFSNNHLYCSADVRAVTDDAYVDSVVWKVTLTGLNSGGLLSSWYWTRSSNSAIGGGPAFRLTQGATGTMYVGSHESTSQLHVSRNADLPSNAGMDSFTVPVSSWTGGAMIANAPTGVNWAARADSRITGGYVTPGVYGFMWHIGRRPTHGRPQPYVRVARFNIMNNHPVGEEEIWDDKLAFLYPAVGVNLAGEPGYTCAFGQGDGDPAGLHPTNFYRVVDPGGCGVGFSGGQLSVPFSGGGSPTTPEWGDHFSVQRSYIFPNTFVASGMALQGSVQVPHYVWFGKEEDTPTTPLVIVETNVVGAAAAVVVTYADLDGRTDGTTPFTRRYPAGARYELTAPPSVTSRGQTY